MENIQTFSLRRIVLLMQKTLYENGKFVLISLGTVFGIFSVILFMSAIGDGKAWSNMEGFYIAGFVIAGVFISGMAFTNLRSKEKTMSYLSLPTSTVEKLISEVLLTTLGFIILYTAIFYLYNFLVYLIGASFNFEPNIINLFHKEVLEGFMYYVIFQSVFLAGAATFRKVPIIFTGFVLFLAGIIIMVYLTILALSMKGYFESLDVVNLNLNVQPHDFESDMESHFLVDSAKFMFYYLTAPIFWFVTYLKLKEKEV